MSDSTFVWRLLGVILLALVLIVAAAGAGQGTASAQTPPADPPPPPLIILFDEPNFGGDVHSDPNSDGDLEDAGSAFDDRASSIRVTGGITVAVYTGYGTSIGTSSCLTVSSDQASLPASFDNAISSYRLNYSCDGGPVAPPSDVPWVKLTANDLTLPPIYITGDTPWLIDEFFNDAADVATVNGPFPVALYEASGYSGACQTIPAGETRNLGSLANTVESVRIGVTCGEPAPGVIFHSATDFQGESLYVTQSRERLTSSPSFDHRASSIELVGGMRSVAVYDQPQYQGRCETFMANDPNIGDNNFIRNDTIASVRVNWTCAGPAPGEVFIRNLKLVNGDSPSVAFTCPEGYDTKFPNLNESVGGASIYLCVQYYWAGYTNAPNWYSGFRTHIRWNKDVLQGDSDILPCEDVGLFGPFWDPLESDRDEGANLPGDLNWGSPRTGQVFDIHFCVTKADPDTELIDRDLHDQPLKDIRFVSGSIQGEFDMPAEEVEAACEAAFGGASGVTYDYGNLNAGVDRLDSEPHLAIYTCLRFGGDPVSPTGPDTTDPVIRLHSRTPADPAGWNKTPVTLEWTCTDAESGALNATVTSVVSTEGFNQSATGICQDNAGNTISHTVSGINIDLTAPTISVVAEELGVIAPPYASGTWTNRDVKVTFLCEDTLSGVFTGTGSVVVTTEGAGQSVDGFCSDFAGNVATTAFNGINIDKSAPVISLVGRTAFNSHGWNNTDVFLEWSCSDALSGPVAATQSKTLSSEGANQAAAATCEDRAGNTSSDTQTGINIDTTAPTIRFVGQTPAANANGWNNTGAELEWSCTDGLSGVRSSTAVRTIAIEGVDLSATGECMDLAGNQTTASQGGVNIDMTDPEISLVSRTPANSHGWNNTDVVVAWECSDELSGPLAVGMLQTISDEGANQSATGFCEDEAGNTASATETGINIDKTAPVVTYADHPASFMVNQTVDIACSASDDLSGIDIDCQGINQPAYLFEIGPNSVSTSATDKAGNVGSASTSFEVQVDAESLSALHERWVSDPDVRESLDDKAQSIAEAPNEHARRGKLRAYSNLLAAQSGKTISAGHAAILLELAQAL